ncbi:hypothetical protein AGABI2DRAFT_121244 [Agaricus bisporus var. bisporus H97]|uniref:hypothetical protein n=1 Tax=Agaricus bisporus var. bisporus (strain H97 / ATCC MYA-4626 / FGSC 10389) TaxID=936046 RepID=UPI00029F51E1|nr:hypothetical protein AGABI2DRAFT_121244 [Agaricus bisporus var. bisporus H97]EKV44049.1 hypothetical protein AGABI2DRAFT_121244 [Agaricus bisporus var. bisporus H97]
MPKPYQEELHNQAASLAFTDQTTRNRKTTWEKVSARCPPQSSAPSDNPALIVHGSLARAGKVKAQTPKVEKQEKKKQPKGRAKKRMLYNRRFVNVTTLPGGKRRM